MLFLGVFSQRWAKLRCAFAFHVIIPTVCRNLKWQHRACRQALLIGTLLALVLNILWVFVVIGSLPLVGQGQGNILAALHEGLPPGIPVIMPGEMFDRARTPKLFEYLEMLEEFDAKFPGFEHEIHRITHVKDTDTGRKRYSLDVLA